MIKYIGSKRRLLPEIEATVSSLPGVRTVLDLFSGTSRVGHALKRAGYDVTANDHNAYALTLARCYVQADAARRAPEATRLLAELGHTPPRAGYFTETFCIKSRFVQPRNGERVDAIRERIRELDLDPELEAVLLVSLMEATDRVDSTCGLQMAYLKQWAPRSHNDLELRLPNMLPGKGRALGLDASEAAQQGAWDLVYLDPPYNQHKYRNNYHVWESLILWDKPEVYGRACKRVDCREYDSAFNSRPRIRAAFERVLRSIRARYLLISFNNEGYLSEEELLDMLRTVGEVRVSSHDYPRYVGAQIGIYNPQGARVGEVSHLRNREHMFLVDTGATPGSSS